MRHVVCVGWLVILVVRDNPYHRRTVSSFGGNAFSDEVGIGGSNGRFLVEVLDIRDICQKDDA